MRKLITSFLAGRHIRRLFDGEASSNFVYTPGYIPNMISIDLDRVRASPDSMVAGLFLVLVVVVLFCSKRG